MIGTCSPGSEGRLNVLVCGGRRFYDGAKLAQTLDWLHHDRCFGVVITGDEYGTDSLTAEWAKVRSVTCEVYHADWLRLGREAGRIRNERMLAEGRPELVVAFPGGRRTAHIVAIARAAGIEVIELPQRRSGHGSRSG
jgi:hypothetical protein